MRRRVREATPAPVMNELIDREEEMARLMELLDPAQMTGAVVSLTGQAWMARADSSKSWKGQRLSRGVVSSSGAPFGWSKACLLEWRPRSFDRLPGSSMTPATRSSWALGEVARRAGIVRRPAPK